MDFAALRGAMVQSMNGLKMAIDAIDTMQTTPSVENAPAPVVTTDPLTPHPATGPFSVVGGYQVMVIDDPNPKMAPTHADQANKTGWPRVVHLDQGANMMVSAPLNRQFKADGWWNIFGTGRAVLTPGRPGQPDWNDPSNGNIGQPPQPLRTPEGFPIQYTYDENYRVIGTGTVVHDGHGFSNDAEVLAYIAAEAAKPVVDHSAEWAAVGQRMREQRQHGQQPAQQGGDTAVDVQT